MSLIGTLFIGLIVGLLARWLKPGSDSMGMILTIALGIAGCGGLTQPQNSLVALVRHFWGM